LPIEPGRDFLGGPRLMLFIWRPMLYWLSRTDGLARCTTAV
jgi:hypothetical protein